jgi:hypothetical protein
LRGRADKIDRFSHFLNGIPIRSEEETYLVHQTTNGY